MSGYNWLQAERERAVVDTSVCSSILGGHNHENIEYIGAYITLKTSSTSSRKRKVSQREFVLAQRISGVVEFGGQWGKCPPPTF